MKIAFLGTCSGTEPMPGRKHVSFVIERGGSVYWFDAGEGCSYTAHLIGIDLLSVRAIFISHAHIDHVGGLPNLLINMRKLSDRTGDRLRSLSGKTVQVFIPDMSVWGGVLQILAATGDDSRAVFAVEANSYQDGLVYEDNGLEVFALHNQHMGIPVDGKTWQSFSFRIEADGKSVVYSGDVADICELSPLLGGCDLFLMETGHHVVEDVCHYLKNERRDFGRLGFIHHGRAILADPDGELEKARAILGDRVFVADDGMQLEV